VTSAVRSLIMGVVDFREQMLPYYVRDSGSARLQSGSTQSEPPPGPNRPGNRKAVAMPRCR
jgi:hypothetical protein